MKAITVELPDDLLPRLRETPEALGQEVRLAAAIRWLRLGRISWDEAAEVAGLEKTTFAAALAEGTRTLAPASEPKSLRQLFAREEAEAHYQALGAWKGPRGARDAQAAAREFWLGAACEGARWLVARLRDERILDRLHGAASMLAQLGDACIAPIFEALSGELPHDQAQSLLWALDSLIDAEPPLRLEGAEEELVLAALLQHDDPDVRESAARAMGLIRSERAVRWLERRLRDEVDAEVKRTIVEEIAGHKAGKT